MKAQHSQKYINKQIKIYEKKYLIKFREKNPHVIKVHALHLAVRSH